MAETHHYGDRNVQRRALWIALGLNASYMVAEVIGGIVFNSLALLADAAHMLSDVIGLGIALYAQRLMLRAASARHTYGFQRAEVLGALANGVTLLAVVGWIGFEAVRRLMEPESVRGVGLLVVAAIGLLINLGSAVILGRAQGRSLNMRGAFIHMASDAAGSVAVIVAALAVILWGASWVDPLASFAIGILVLWATWGLLRDTVHVLMEGAPKQLKLDEVEEAMTSHEGVKEIHHLHLWNLASDVPALSAHVLLRSGDSLHDAQLQADHLKALLHERFGIEHVTLELECHSCETEPAGAV
ncbi:MAG: cation diffusion facilitator family transporter [Actinomycetota bacterium]